MDLIFWRKLDLDSPLGYVHMSIDLKMHLRLHLIEF